MRVGTALHVAAVLTGLYIATLPIWARLIPSSGPVWVPTTILPVLAGTALVGLGLAGLVGFWGGEFGARERGRRAP